MTPELPRAPIRLPWAATRAILPTSPAWDSRMSSTADCSVRSMFVPVSPSGTGKTFRRLISSWCAFSHARLPNSACFRSWPSTLPAPAPLDLAVIPVSPLHEDVHLGHSHSRRSLHLEPDRALQVVRDLGDPDTVLHHHVEVDGELAVELVD